jgi:alpha-galactosidase
MCKLPSGQLGHLYYGERLQTTLDYVTMFPLGRRVLNPYSLKDKPEFSLEVTKQELPIFGTTDFREGVLALEGPDGGHVYEFIVKGHKVIEGKSSMTSSALPMSHCAAEDASSLIFTLVDAHSHLEIQLTYTIFNNLSVITRSMVIQNKGQETHQIHKALSLNVDFEAEDFDMLHLSGAWSRERHLKRHPLHPGIQSVGSTRGASSAQHNPFFALLDSNATEDSGRVYGFNLIYSGNFIGQVEKNHYNQLRVQLGIHPECFKWVLRPNDLFEVPEAVMMYSNEGLNGLSYVSHQFIKKHILPVQHTEKLAPVLINNWEATYFDFTEKSLFELAKTSKDLGIDLFVLDDGWFMNRNSDRSALGDWDIDPIKFPRGLKPFAEDLRSIGLKFGIWIEPEMVNEESHLYKNHPEWVIQTPGHTKSYGRYQWVLDYSREDVVTYIFNKLGTTLDDIKPDYVKWDMNRYITEAYSLALEPHRQGEFYHRYILGVYDLYLKLTSRYPEMVIESCASGGGRFDLGMLCYAPQTWTSDDTDAIERLKIQYGTSIPYPLQTMGSHVSAIPNHQVLRQPSLTTRHNVAVFGTYGYELDVRHMDETQREAVKHNIAFFKTHQELINNGRFYRLKSPFNTTMDQWVAWMVVSEDQTKALVGVYQILQEPNPWIERIKLRGLDPNRSYRLNQSEQLYGGDQLIYNGLIINDLYAGLGEEISSMLTEGDNSEKPLGYGDFTSKLYVLEAN